jgi:hypothetical protein
VVPSSHRPSVRSATSVFHTRALVVVAGLRPQPCTGGGPSAHGQDRYHRGSGSADNRSGAFRSRPLRTQAVGPMVPLNPEGQCGLDLLLLSGFQTMSAMHSVSTLLLHGPSFPRLGGLKHIGRGEPNPGKAIGITRKLDRLHGASSPRREMRNHYRAFAGDRQILSPR